MKGRIHSIESMGLVDGPGIRTVVFFQGCSLRCAYCHNPDTWNCGEGSEIDSEELMKKILRYKLYFNKSGGGVTFSGGDPLMQPEFLIEMLKLCKAHGIHTTLDTAGYGHGRYDEILQYVDLIILDIKHVDNRSHIALTGRNREGFLKFLEAVNKTSVKLWTRHVVVPDITDGEDHIIKLAEIVSGIKNLEKVELLPYHTMGVNKFKELGIPYRLEGVVPTTSETISRLTEILNKNIELYKNNN